MEIDINYIKTACLIIGAILAFTGFVWGVMKPYTNKYNTNLQRLYTSIQVKSDVPYTSIYTGREIQVVAQFEDDNIHSSDVKWAKLYDVKTGNLIKEYNRKEL